MVEEYGTNNPIQDLTHRGSYTSDENTYDLYIGDDRFDPAVYGGADRAFTQIKAINRNQRGSETITMANHFGEWANYEFAVRNLYEVSYKIEGFSNLPFSNDSTIGNATISADFSTSGSFIGGASSSGNNNNNNNSSSGNLSGNYKLKTGWGTRYATSNNTNGAELREHQSQDWTSQEFEFIKTGDEYRIQEKYGNRYLEGASNNFDTVVVLNLNIC